MDERPGQAILLSLGCQRGKKVGKGSCHKPAFGDLAGFRYVHWQVGSQLPCLLLLLSQGQAFSSP